MNNDSRTSSGYSVISDQPIPPCPNCERLEETLTKESTFLGVANNGWQFEEQRNKELQSVIEHLQAQLAMCIEALEYYANPNSWYLQKDQVLGSEVRRSIEYFDTESGSRMDDKGNSVLFVNAGKRARECLAKLEGEK